MPARQTTLCQEVAALAPHPVVWGFTLGNPRRSWVAEDFRNPPNGAKYNLNDRCCFWKARLVSNGEAAGMQIGFPQSSATRSLLELSFWLMQREDGPFPNDHEGCQISRGSIQHGQPVQHFRALESPPATSDKWPIGMATVMSGKRGRPIHTCSCRPTLTD